MAACISECGKYRYWLHRKLNGTGRALLVCMLNPSTADHTHNDATIKALIAYGTAWGYGYLEVVNLYAYRATNPRDLWTVPDPIGPDNDNYLRYMADNRAVIVVAWGTNAPLERQNQVAKLLRASGNELLCFDTNANGSPKHPLYVRRDTPLKVWGVDGVI